MSTPERAQVTFVTTMREFLTEPQYLSGRKAIPAEEKAELITYQ
jgi:hypothetical protein